MIFEQEEVIELIENGVTKHISDAREYADLLNMHVTGKGVKEHTERFNEHESEQQKKLRERLIKSNRSLFSFGLRPMDKIFTAKGGAINYNLPEQQVETIKDGLVDVSAGLDLKTYLKSFAKLQYVVDPNAFVMVDIDSEGELESKIFNVHDVVYYSNRGNQLEAVIFNPYESDNEDDTKKYYRVIDDATDSIYIQDGENIYLDETSVLENYFGFVAGRILGDIICPNTGMYLSLIHDVLDDAEEHLRDVSVNIVHKLSHGYAKYWQYPEACTTCGGDGILKKMEDDEVKEYTCHTCNGSGVKNRKDASDVMILDIPQEGEHVVAPNVGGYINPSMEVWKQYKQDIQDTKHAIFQTLWGSTFSVDSSNETATGKLLNVQPEAERVSSISITFAKLHQFILDCFGKAILGRKDYESNVTYGTRYLMESPDEILSTLQDAKEKNLPSIIQNNLTDKYYQAEYANNNVEYNKIKKLLLVDPFPNMSAKEVKELGVTGIELNKKIFYQQWLSQLTEAKQLLMTTEQLKDDLTNYVESLKLEIKDGTEVQKGSLDPTNE